MNYALSELAIMERMELGDLCWSEDKLGGLVT